MGRRSRPQFAEIRAEKSLGRLPQSSRASQRDQGADLVARVDTGDGPMAAMMSKMGAVETTTVIDSVETGALDDALFQVPADYKIKQK